MKPVVIVAIIAMMILLVGTTPNSYAKEFSYSVNCVDGELHVTVLSENGEPLPNVIIREGDVTKKYLTDENGIAKVPSKYQLWSLSKGGYNDQKYQRFQLCPANTTAESYFQEIETVDTIDIFSHKYPDWVINLGTWFVEQKISSKDFGDALDNLIEREIITSNVKDHTILKLNVAEELATKGKDFAKVHPYIIKGGDRLVGFYNFNPNSKSILYEISRETDSKSHVNLCPDCKTDEKTELFNTQFCKSTSHLNTVYGEYCEQGWIPVELWFGKYLLEVDGNSIPIIISNEGSSYPILTTETSSGMTYCHGQIMTKEQCDSFFVPKRDPNSPVFNSGLRDDHVYGDKPEWYETYWDNDWKRDRKFFDCATSGAGNIDWALEVAQECLANGRCVEKHREDYIKANC